MIDMTDFLIDVASYQQGINLDVVKQAGFNKINVKLSQGNFYKWNNAGTYLKQGMDKGFGICTFHWLDNSDTGANQARIVISLMKQYGVFGITAHQCDCEDTKKPATWNIWKDYVNAMQDALGRHIVNYTGDWWWTPHMGRNNASAVTPYLWAAPNHGYDRDYPGDSSLDWLAGYGGWHDYAILQYAVSPIANAGGGNLSKSAIKHPEYWVDLTGGDMSGEADKAFSVPYTGTEPWVNGQGWVAKALETPLREANQKLDELKNLLSADTDALATKIADKLIASVNNPLTAANLAAVKSAVMEVLNNTKLSAS